MSKTDDAKDDPGSAAPPAVLEKLAAEHGRFLGFVQKRVGSRAEAEEVLQQAFLKGAAKAESIREEESAVAWFYRVLRNAIVDHLRARGRDRARAEADAGVEDLAAAPPQTRQEICRCVAGLVETLPPSYAEAVREIDLGEQPVAHFAAARGLTANNARVRLHRAREALRRQVSLACRVCAQHGCLDCSCPPADS